MEISKKKDFTEIVLKPFLSVLMHINEINLRMTI